MGLFKGLSKLVLYLLILAIVAVAGAGGLYYFLLNEIRGKSIMVPKLVGMEATDAIETVLESGLTLRGIEERYSDIIQPGYIVEQSPMPNTVVKSGRPVTLIKSKGYEETEVPSLVGQMAEDAEMSLYRAGLRLGRKAEVPNPKVPTGRVIVQQPGLGQKASKGSAVNVLVSLGPVQHAYIMPNVTGLSRSEAEEELRALGFNRIIKEERSNVNDPPGIVLDQNPSPGSQVMLSSQVYLAISKEETSAQQASVVVEESETIPERLDTEVEPEIQATPTEITAQEPATPTPTQTPSSRKYTFVYPLPRPKGAGWVEVKSKTGDQTKTVYTGIHSRGGLIEFDTFVEPETQFIIYQDGQKIGTKEVEPRTQRFGEIGR